MTFEKQVLSIRESLNLTQQKFADEVGVSFATINRWENGAQSPSRLGLRILSEFCNKRGIPFSYESYQSEKDGISD